MNRPLEDKVCVITGASSGIGKALVRALVHEGARVLGIGHSAAHIAQTRAEIPEERFCLIQGDVSHETSVCSAFELCKKRFGEIDILINNAGVGTSTPDLASVDAAVFDHMFSVNVRGVFLCTREAIREMKPRGRGYILTIVSMASHRANATAPIYCASKFAVRGFCLGLAEQVLKYGIRVTMVNPGPVNSNYWGSRPVPRERMLNVEDVASLVSRILTLPEHIVVHEINFDSMAWYAQ